MHRYAILFIAVFWLYPELIYCQDDCRFAYVNSSEIYNKLPAVDSITRLLNAEKAEMEMALEKMQVEFNRLIESLETENDNSSELIRNSKIAVISDMERRIQQFTIDAQNTLRTRNQELVTPIIVLLDQAIEKIANTMNITYVFDTSEFQFAFISKSAVCIDKLVLEELGISSD